MGVSALIKLAALGQALPKMVAQTWPESPRGLVEAVANFSNVDGFWSFVSLRVSSGLNVACREKKTKKEYLR